jgi:hypothetical protein
VSLLARRIAFLLLTAAVAGGMLALPVSAKTGPVASASKCKKAKKGKRRKKKKCNGSNPSATTLPGQSTHPTPTASTPPVVPVALQVNSLGVTDNPVLAGRPTQGQVTISGVAPSGGQPVSLSSDSSRASVPSSVVVAPGQTTATFPVTTSTGTATTTTLTASIGGSSANRQLDLVSAPSVTSVALDHQCYPGPGSFTANSVTLDVAPLANTPVTLASSDPLALSVSSPVMVPAGSKTAFFPVTVPLTAVLPNPSVTVTATLSPSPPVSDSASIRDIVSSPPTAADLALSPDSVTLGDTSMATVTLDCEAPTAGAVVNLISSDPSDLTVDPVTVPGGSLSVTFQVTATATGTYDISATAAAGGPTRHATLTVNNLAT